MRTIICLLMLFTFLLVPTREWAQTRVSTADELRPYYNIADLPAYRPNTISGQTSTYDTTGGNEDGFNGNYSFVKRNADSSLVIFDQKGPGVVNRIWTPTPTQDTLDFYIDDMSRPVLSICYMDLFSGKTAPFSTPLCGNQLGGYYCYYPILFQQRCQIVCRGKRMQFHQIQYRLYPAGTPVTAFTGRPDREAQAALEAIGKLWNRIGEQVMTGPTLRNSFQLHPGETKVIAQITQGGRITGLTLSPATVLENLGKGLDIRVYWDDEKTPAVDCPAADLFGFAFGDRSMQSLLLGTKENKAYCYFPMPFDQKARVELVYREGEMPLPLSSEVYYTLQGRDREREGKFYSYWNSEHTVLGKPHVFLDVKGKGHFVGTLLQAQGLQPGMTIFFEGDDSTVIDGQLRLHGTGSEDYFNGGWYALQDRWDTKMSLPLHGALDYSLAFSRTGGYRLYLGDKLSFGRSFYHSIEHGPEHNNTPAIYTSVALYYGSMPPGNVVVPTDTRVYMPDTVMIYPQFSRMILGSDMDVSTIDSFASIGQAVSLRVEDHSFLKLSLDELLPGTYRVFVDARKVEDGCRYMLWQRQTPVSGWMEGGSAEVGTVVVTELNKTITFRFATEEGRHRFVLSKLMLIKNPAR